MILQGGRLGRWSLPKKTKKSEAPERGDTTPETQAKLRPDPLDYLKRQGVLDEEMELAANEIRDIWEGITAKWFPQISGFHDRAMYRQMHPQDGLSRKLFDAYMARYVPWSKSGKIGEVATVFMVVVDGKACGEVDRRNGWLNGHCRDVVIKSLRRYGTVKRRRE